MVRGRVGGEIRELIAVGRHGEQILEQCLVVQIVRPEGCTSDGRVGTCAARGGREWRLWRSTRSTTDEQHACAGGPSRHDRRGGTFATAAEGEDIKLNWPFPRPFFMGQLPDL